jgi:hypothetical protein
VYTLKNKRKEGLKGIGVTIKQIRKNIPKGIELTVKHIRKRLRLGDRLLNVKSLRQSQIGNIEV